MADPTREELLKRTNSKRITGTMTSAFKSDNPGDNFCLNARDAVLYYDENDGTAAPISIGKGGTPNNPAVLGGRVVGRIPWNADWQEVKSKWDAASVRLEGKGQLVCFDVRLKNMEDGFEPHPDVNPNGNLTNTFWFEGAYMEHIRDDAIENDQIMPGMIRDCYIEVANFLLSEQADSQGIRNPNAVTKVENVLFHSAAMPNSRSKNGKMGAGGVFKWRTGAGKVACKDCIFLIDVAPNNTNKWPAGTYNNCTAVIGPSYKINGRPPYIPTSVAVTRDMKVWETAKGRWLASHPAI
jgi:hypothetical protein